MRQQNQTEFRDTFFGLQAILRGLHRAILNACLRRLLKRHEADKPPEILVGKADSGSEEVIALIHAENVVHPTVNEDPIQGIVTLRVEEGVDRAGTAEIDTVLGAEVERLGADGELVDRPQVNADAPGALNDPAPDGERAPRAGKLRVQLQLVGANFSSSTRVVVVPDSVVTVSVRVSTTVGPACWSPRVRSTCLFRRG